MSCHVDRDSGHVCLQGYTTHIYYIHTCTTCRRDQIANGLATFDGMSVIAARQLAAHIPPEKYPASIEDVKQHCCKNLCFDCKGAHFYGNVQVLIHSFCVCIDTYTHSYTQVKGFLCPSKDDEWLTLTQFINPKKEDCEWRYSKRRSRDQDGNLSSPQWLGRCVSCNDKKR